MADIDHEICARVTAECLCYRARKAARTVTRIYDEALRPAGLKATQFTLLVAIRRGAPRSVTALAEGLGMERTTLLRNLRLLEKQGLIQQSEGGSGRSRRLRLTAEGKTRVVEAYPYWRQAHERLTTHLGEDGRALVISALGRLAGSEGR